MNQAQVVGAEIDPTAVLGARTRVWQLAHVREGATVGHDCVVGRGAYIGPGVRIGNAVKIQNYALVYDPAVVDDGVFIGPAAILTNDRAPRAVKPDGTVQGAEDWEPQAVHVRQGASIGARAVCVAPVVIGAWAMVGAGSVVTRDVPDFALVVGSPAKQVGWVGHCGHKLEQMSDSTWLCPETGRHYRQHGGQLTEVTS